MILEQTTAELEDAAHPAGAYQDLTAATGDAEQEEAVMAEDEFFSPQSVIHSSRRLSIRDPATGEKLQMEHKAGSKAHMELLCHNY